MQSSGQKLSRANSLYSTEKKSEELLTKSVDEMYPERPAGPLSVWTTGIWERESMVIRWIEKSLVYIVNRWSAPRHGESLDTAVFLKEVSQAGAEKRSGLIKRLWSKFRT